MTRHYLYSILYTMSDSEDPLALINAIKNCNTIDEIHELIKSGIDVNTADCDGWTALMLVARYGREHGAGMIRLLLDAGADVDKQEVYGWTALLFAAAFGGEHGAGMIKILLDAGADADKQDSYGRTALVFAIDEGGEHGVGMVRFLVASGARIPLVSKLNIRTTHELAWYIHGAQNWTPLHRAADARDADAIIKCMSEGMRPDAVVESSHQDMHTALSIAESTSYPTAQPVCDDCLALLRPSLMKSSTPSGSLFGGGGGGGGGVGGAQK